MAVSDSDSDVAQPMGRLGREQAAAATAAGSDDDDVPLAALAQPKAKEHKPKEHKVKAPKVKTPKSPKQVGKTKRPRSSTPTESDDTATKRARTPAKRSEGGARKLDKSQPLKEQAVEAILVRWQYVPDLAAAWPPVKAAAFPVGPDFKALDGFPGVFIGIGESEHVGKVLDMRPVKPCPSKAYLMTLPSETLAHYWTLALQGQRDALLQAEGPEAEASPLAAALQAELASSAKFLRLAARADKEAERKVQEYKAMLKAEKSRRKRIALELMGMADSKPTTAGPAAPAAAQ